MTTPPTFPTLAGLGWSVHKKPAFNSVVAPHVSGREVRTALYVMPIWTFELTIDGLDSGSLYPGLGARSQQALMGFFLSCQGKFGTFLFTDPTDSAVTAGAIGTGDGVTQTFTFARSMGSFLEPVGWVTSVANVYVGGVAQTTGWVLVAPNSLVFTSPPAAGAAITATFAFAFQCRFDDDTLDFEQFMKALWRVDKLTFRSVRSS